MQGFRKSNGKNGGGQHQYVEILKSEKARYVSASVAFCQLLQFDIVERHSTGVSLDMHLENRHIVYIRKYNERRTETRRKLSTNLSNGFLKVKNSLGL